MANNDRGSDDPFVNKTLISGPLPGFDKLHRVLQYLAYSWGVDTPREYMQANIDARTILIRLENEILDEAEALH